MAIQQNLIDKLIPGLDAADHRQHYLQAIVKEYPFYAAAQLAFVKEHSPNDLSINEAKQRAALVWHPLVLEQFLFNKNESLEEDDDDGVPEIPSMKAVPLSEIEEEETNDDPKIELDNHSTEPKEFNGSVMDIAAAYEEDENKIKEEDELSAWDQREILESSLADETNASTNEEDKEEEIIIRADNVVEEVKQMEHSTVLGDSITLSKASKSENIPVTDARENEDVIFEPLHTSDYFASQGIKLSEEKIPTDKLGIQLKSFTEWLQTMKRIHPTNIDLKINLNQEVATLAEKSNLEKEVITESMAIAYIAQGKPQKAADIYEKLKLIYPHKSAYFAAELGRL